jgi:DNA-binding NtrC family response regulator
VNTVELVNAYFKAEAQRASLSGQPPRQLKVLIIDDDTNFNEMASITLKNNGVLVDVSTDGETGHWQAFTNEYDLILLDLKMADIDGAEVLKRIKADRPDARVVICTGYAQSEILARAMQYGPFGVVEKPEELQALMQVFKHYNLLRKPPAPPTPC